MSRILIIEDDPYVRALYQKLFDLQKYEVLIAKNGTEGLELAQTQRPNIILLDILMPQIDGLAVLKTLKSDPLTKNIPVLMLTNIGSQEVIRKATELGADAFMVKADFSPDQILSQVNTYMKEFLKTVDNGTTS